MKAEDIKKVLIAGAGTMGQSIGLSCAAHGYAVVLYDVKDEMLTKAKESMAKKIDKMAGAGALTKEAAEAMKARITATMDLAAAAAEADIVSESIPEDPAMKGEFFGKLNGVCPERTIFTTNTSSLVPSMFADKTGRPDRFLAFHFHPGFKLVDVMGHPGTSPDAVETVRRFAGLIGHSPIVLKQEKAGYLFNSLLNPWLLAAINLVSRDIASPEDVDRSWKEMTAMPLGPFALMDFVGLETVWRITDFWARKRGDENAQKSAELLKQYVDRGELGMKSGKGFFDYSGKK
jgi:3-hydroxybutyryl-CoA dehydrogenase